MERRINKRIESYVTDFKDSLRDRISVTNLSDKEKGEILQYIYDFDRLTIDKDDFQKRKRVKNVVPHLNRCCAKRANGEQCTRRKKNELDEYCGTHMKGTPHGVIDLTSTTNSTSVQKKIEVWAQDIHGIVYYIDKDENVYQAEDIVSNKLNPVVIAKYMFDGTKYSIPEYGI